MIFHFLLMEYVLNVFSVIHAKVAAWPTIIIEPVD